MLYLLLCTFVLFIGIAKMHTHLFQMFEHEHGNGSAPRPNVFAGLTGIIPALAFTLPVTIVFLDVLGNSTWGFDMYRVVVYAVLVGSLALLAQGLLGLRQALKSRSMDFWPMGRVVVLILAGVVGSMSAGKHLAFFTSSQDGYANVGLLREIADLSDMKDCKSGIALVQFREAGPINYRCPSLLIFGSDTQQPFIPWPDYVEGASQGLADAIKLVNDSADHGYTVKKLEH
ncbi:TPA: hypothetical protein ACKQHR_001595 [Pseudomonas aeruginosa]|nr:hypothetical protein [Pseudomonas aeruginosa]